MSRVRYLVDTSVFARLSKPVVSAAFAPYAATGQVGMCAPVAFEIGYSARSHDDYLLIAERLLSFTGVPVNDADHRRALDIQQLLSATGQHRTLSLVDALVAAVAESKALTILHYDSDYETVAAVTKQPHEWIVPRGTADL
jgi:predicted nucleic acid-binding protein